MQPERRMTPPCGINIEERADGTRVIHGYGAVFFDPKDPGTTYQLSRSLTERIAAGAFDRAIAERADVVGLFNHDANFVLGRTSSGTMRLSSDSRGLKYEIDYNPNDPQHVSVMEKLKRGDVSGSSFAFQVRKQSFAKGEAGDVRTIEDVELIDTGPVAMPAYRGTTTGVRSGNDTEAEQAREEWKKRAWANDAEYRYQKAKLDISTQVS